MVIHDSDLYSTTMTGLPGSLAYTESCCGAVMGGKERRFTEDKWAPQLLAQCPKQTAFEINRLVYIYA
jgi:hypothetical protein